MRVPISWLKEYVDIDMTPQALGDMVTNAGMEVEKIEYIGIEGADLVWDREKVLLGQLLKVEKHPDADTLVLATVEYGGDEPKVVVTGAPNLKPYIGEGDLSNRDMWGAIIFEGGVYLNPYKDGKPTTLKGKALRGIYNDAMLCSEVELAVGEDHDGIMIFEGGDFSAELTPGTPLQDVLGDAVLEIDIIPNIARTASMIGIAREVAALTGKELRYPDYSIQADGEPVGDRVVISTENPEFNPRFTAILIEGVEQKESPYWMRRRLALAGQRAINVVVDISNYVMLEMGQPNHTYDFDFLKGRADAYGKGQIHLTTRLAQEGETLTTLDGKEHKLFSNNILVTDPAGNLGLGGVMGGFNSEIQDNTSNVLLEAAAWNFINIRQTQRQLNLFTEAGFRFSRGVHPTQALFGAKRAAELMRKYAGGTIAQGIIDYHPLQTEQPVVGLTLDYAQKLSGLDLSMAEMAALLERLEFVIVELKEGSLQARVPEHRLDVEGAHDLVEEVCRVYGYDKVPATVLADVLPTQRGNVPFEREQRIEDALVDRGMQQVITYRLTTQAAEQKALTGDADDRPYISLLNPSTMDRVDMRHNLLASVLEVAAANTRFVDRIGIFEVGQIYLPSEDETAATELPRLAMVLTGQRERAHWQSGTPEMYDFFDIKGMVDGLLAEMHVNVRWESAEHPTFRPGRTAQLFIGESQKLLGTVGELHPLVVDAYGMRVEKEQSVLAADIDMQMLINAMQDSFKVDPLPLYPAVNEDLALLVDEAVTSAEVEATITKAGGYLLKNVELFDIFTGKGIPAGKKSLAYRLTFQSPGKTLKDKDVTKLRKKVVGTVKHQLGAILRDGSA